ncbi:formimidoylglutamase [Piscirickettsia salmonis]|uniref:formimidoylglutamase n=1 Tax=Piscirickettsia salmonis TaxID=1238 RepID=UPI000332D077|nr:formimidoylglutamase [Piscirickettsia salmonis]ERL62281.1 formimidoylglutamase [Piscirickettsia salmonis LF-89 = ATCC VR-1361]RNC78002.1 formimidoylglutamase [Piscirickettsiaceae bacterium NZ-RLO2]WGZ71562.1 formimidoylglutamase [Piscirickettsia salmonis EM-90]APS45768.1 formimidoylglutamase [Piscirickettsia salmonis]APS49014.1 formimidoylglutamase [Piscirickettsia salmonis]
MQLIDQVPYFWQGRDDGVGARRFFQAVEALDYSKLSAEHTVALTGFCSDEGVKRNLGRPGAAMGPAALRNALVNLSFYHSMKIADLGDICCQSRDLELAQTKLAVLSESLAKKNILSIVLGGGHEVAWGHGLGLFKAAFEKNKKVGVINLDAHLDLRPLINGVQGSSGTPFKQLADFCKENNHEFNYCCIGLQPYANTESLFATAQLLGVEMVSASEVKNNYLSVKEKIIQFCENVDTVYLTLCLDVFAESIAPGVSAPQAFGLAAEQVQVILEDIINLTDLIGFDIAELAPCYDQGQQTAHLGAYLLNDVIHLWQEKKQ